MSLIGSSRASTNWVAAIVARLLRRAKRLLHTLVKETSRRTGLYRRSFFSVYRQWFSPQQLIFLAQCIESTRNTPGACVEIGCAQGGTTVFLAKYLQDLGVEKTYFAIDTFSGFDYRDVDYEVLLREKTTDIKDLFVDNKREWVEESIALADVPNVEIIESDVKDFDFSCIGSISFCLVDVDLYMPTVIALDKVYDLVQPGGMIIVDDCMENQRWDGAYLAYKEFVDSKNLPEEIVCHQLGVIRKPIVNRQSTKPDKSHRHTTDPAKTPI